MGRFLRCCRLKKDGVGRHVQTVCLRRCARGGEKRQPVRKACLGHNEDTGRPPEFELYLAGHRELSIFSGTTNVAPSTEN